MIAHDYHCRENEVKSTMTSWYSRKISDREKESTDSYESRVVLRDVWTALYTINKHDCAIFKVNFVILFFLAAPIFIAHYDLSLSPSLSLSSSIYLSISLYPLSIYIIYLSLFISLSIYLSSISLSILYLSTLSISYYLSLSIYLSSIYLH